ncbi:MAG: methylated-DNA--[Victivallales bacterium]|jgi:methylated-DNA-[protein]-cysteine S-methyltransferase|nr:methylated-DNA--[protein]-cysteine S-methyltransferase [Victivallales bacterium]
MYMTKYESPVGNLTLVSNGCQLTGLFVDGQRYFPDVSKMETKKDLAVFDATIHWLDAYFEGKSPCGETIPLKPEGTAFRMAVWKLLMAIPYGETTTYGELARKLNETAGMKTCARAVGNAVGHNPISIIIPCHRVVGADGGLTGYAGGLDVKQKLLKLEQKRN